MSATDFSEIGTLTDQIMEVSDLMTSMAKGVAKARQIREYDSDRRKRALSLSVRDALNAAPDLSATAAEHKGRASDGYGASMQQLAQEMRSAENAVAEWEALKVKFECLRSVLSIQKAGMNIL